MNEHNSDQRIALLLADPHDESVAADAAAAVAWYLSDHSADTPVEVFGSISAEAVLARLANRDDASSELLPVVESFYEQTPWHVVEPGEVHRRVAEFAPTVRIVACPRQLAGDLGVQGIAGCRDVYFTPDTEASSASLVAYLGLTLVPDHDRWFTQTKQHIAQLMRVTANKPTAAVFGTGPTYAEIDWSRFDDSATIICNSIVKQVEIFDLINPVAVCAADPVFHSSYSAYAEEFRRCLVEALRATEMPFFFPVRDLGVYLNYLPEDMHDRLAPIELAQRDDFVLDLTRDVQVKSTANVLTLLLLPLAFTLKQDVWIAGCDGKPGSSDYFWQHAADAQFGNQMDSVKSLFGGFFEIDYDDYYADHLQTLGELLDQAETQGKFARSVTPSYIPSLRKREIVQPMGTRDIQARKPFVHEFCALRAALALVYPLGVSLHEGGLVRLGLREYLNRELRAGFCTDWTPGLPTIATFPHMSDAKEFLQTETSDVVVVNGGEEALSVQSDAPGWPPHWIVTTWASAQRPGESRHFMDYRADVTGLDPAHGRHWTAYGFQSSTTASLFARMLDAELIA